MGVVLGGTDWGDLLNIEPYGCRRKAWYKHSGVKPDFEQVVTKAMSRGVRLEDVAADIYASNHRGIILWPGNDFDKPTYELPEWWGGHPDRIITRNGEHQILEIKTVNQWAWRHYQENGPRKEHIMQLQHYLWLAGADSGVLMYYWPDGDIWDEEVIAADREMFDLMLGEGAKFVHEVETGQPPERREFGYKACRSCPWRKSCWAGYEPEKRQEEETADMKDAELVGAIEDVTQAKLVLEEAKAAYQLACVRLQKIMQVRKLDAVALGDDKVIWREVTQKRLDAKALKNEMPDIYERFTRPVVTRPFKVLTKGNSPIF